MRNYYKNRDKLIDYQREYDRDHKEIKRDYDRKRTLEKSRNKLRVIQNSSRKKNFPILLQKYHGCQLCSSKKKLQIHHKKYTDKIEDCMLLCYECHKKIHLKNSISDLIEK